MKKKITKSGLTADESCKLIKNSGFKADKKARRDKRINSRAGLHGKNKADGERLVKRRKPLALKHRHRIAQMIAALSAVAVVSVGVVGFGFFRSPEVPGLSGEYATVCYATPTDGSSPSEHTAVENVGYMNYVLQRQSYWSSKMESEVKTIISQHVATYKQFYNGVLISADITTSSMVNSAKQFCVVDDVVLWRGPVSGRSSDWNGMDTEWSTASPEGLTRSDYKANRGLPPDEFSVYVINENTVEAEGTSQTAVDNGDGTYSVTLNLKTNLGLGGEGDDPVNSAVYYYKQQMLVTGGLTAYPKYDSISVTYTFDSDWRILSTEIDEAYTAYMGVAASCASSSLTVYEYGDDDLCRASYEDYYENYFSGYVGSFSAPEEEGLTVANALSTAFGSVLTDGAVFKLDLTLDNSPVSGVIYVGMDDGALSEVTVTLGNIRIYLADENGEKYAYLSYGEGVGIKLGLDDLTSLTGGEGSSLSFDADELLSQLSGGEFIVSEDGTEASLTSKLEIFGLEIPLGFTFRIDGDEVSLGSVNASIDLGFTNIGAALSFGTDKDIPDSLTEAEKAAYTDVSAGDGLAGLIGMFKSENYALDFSYGNEYISLSGNVKFNAANLVAVGSFTVELLEDESAAKEIGFICSDGVVYLSLSSDGLEPVKLKAVISEAAEIISAFIGDDFAADIRLPSIDAGSLILKILADEEFAAMFNLDGSTLTIDGTALLGAFGLDFDLGDVCVAVGDDGSLTLDVLGIYASFGACEAFDCDTSDYVNATDAAIVLENLLNILDAQAVTLSGSAVIRLDGAEISVAIENLSVDWSSDALKAYAKIYLTFGGYTHEVCALYDGVTVKVCYDAFGVEIAAEDADDILSAVLNLYTAITGAELAVDGLNVVPDTTGILEIINGLTISTNADGNIAVNFGAIGAEIIDNPSGNSLFSVKLSYYGDVTAEISADVLPFAGFGTMPETDYLGGDVLLSLLGDAAEIAEAGGVSLGGKIYIGTAKTDVALDVKSLAISWKDGLGFSMQTDIIVSDTVIPLYVSYVGGEIALVYGTGENYTAVKLDGDGLDALSSAIVETYNRIVAVINAVLDDRENQIATVESLNDILALLGAGGDVAVSLDAVLNLIGVQSENADVLTLISSAEIYNPENGIIGIRLGGVRLELAQGGENQYLTLGLNASLSVQTSSVQIYTENVALSGYNPVTVQATQYLTGEDIADMLDYLALSAELLVKDELTLTVTGALKEGGVSKYDIVATLEYSQGGGGFPVKVDWDDEKSVTVNSDIYVHLNIGMNSHIEGVESFVLGIYLLDATPVSSNGKTTGAVSSDGELDIYLSLSKLAEDDAHSAPLMVYAPVSEVMTLASALAAMLDLGSVDVGSEEISAIIASLSEVLDELLIDKYIPSTRDQFASLGNSLIPQILGVSLGDLLGSIFDGFSSGAGENGAEGSLCDGSFIKNVTHSSESFEIVFNSSAIYKRPVTANIVFGAEKYYDLSGASVLKRLSISNVYIDSSLKNLLSLGLDFGYDQVERRSAFKDFIDFTGLDNLIKSLINTATHQTETAGDYALNDNFFISGDITMSLLGTNVTVNVEGVSVTIDENNKIKANIKFSYSPSVIAKIVISQSATVEMTIVNDMVYMRRTVSGVPEYRIMTLSAFGADVMNQMVWLFSFTSLVADQMTSSEGGSMPVTYDYGDMLAAWLSSYTYTTSAGGEKWTFTINGDTISSLAGITISDVPVTISATDNGDGSSTLGTLALSGKMFGLISFSADFGYRNPYGEFTGGYYDTTVNLADGVEISDGYTWYDILGGDSFGEISSRINWTKMLSELGTTYLGYTSGGNLSTGELKYVYKDDSVSAALGSQYVLYNGSTKTVYTRLTYPDVGEYEKVAQLLNKTVVWMSDYEIVDGEMVLYAVLENTYTVTITSDYKVDDGFTAVTDGEGNTVYTQVNEKVYKQIMLPKDTVISVDGKYYGLKGYRQLFADGNYYDCEFTVTAYNEQGLLCFVVNVSDNLVLCAVWEEVYQVTFIADGAEDILRYYYADEDVSENLPEVPEIKGYSGEWIVDDDTFVSESGRQIFAQYTLITYSVTVYSGQLPVEKVAASYYDEETDEWLSTEQQGWTKSGEGYKATFAFVYETLVSFGGISFTASPDTFICHGLYFDTQYLKPAADFAVEGDITLYVSWEPKLLTVNYISYDANGNEVSSVDSVQVTYTLATPSAPADRWQFLGWWFNDAESGWMTISDVTGFVVAGVETITVYAMWVKFDVNVTAASNAFKWGTVYFYHTVTCEASYTLYGVADIIDNVTSSGMNILFNFNDGGTLDGTTTNGSISTVTASFSGRTGSSGSVTSSVYKSTGRGKYYWNVIPYMTFDYRGAAISTQICEAAHFNGSF